MATITLPSGIPEGVRQIVAKLAEASLADSGTASVRTRLNHLGTQTHS